MWFPSGAKAQACAACQFRSECCPGNQHHGRSVVRAVHSPEVRQFAEKMQTEAAKAVYRQRGAVAEFPNAWIKDKLGLKQFRLRGLIKVRLEVLWAALTYNIQQWIRLSWRTKLAPANDFSWFHLILEPCMPSCRVAVASVGAEGCRRNVSGTSNAEDSSEFLGGSRGFSASPRVGFPGRSTY